MTVMTAPQKKRRGPRGPQHTQAERRAYLERLVAGEPVGRVAADAGVHPYTLWRWAGQAWIAEQTAKAPVRVASLEEMLAIHPEEVIRMRAKLLRQQVEHSILAQALELVTRDLPEQTQSLLDRMPPPESQ